MSVASPGVAPADRAAGAVAALFLEVVEGRRSWDQLRPLLTPPMRWRVAHQLLGARRVGGPHGRVRRVVTTSPRPGVCEAVVLVERAGRVTALAVRLEQAPRGWRVVELAAPEAHLPAVR